MRSGVVCAHVQCFGTFDTAKEAGQIYDMAYRHIYGDEAVLNFPLTGYLDKATGKLKPEWEAAIPAAARAAKKAGASRKRHRRKHNGA